MSVIIAVDPGITGAISIIDNVNGDFKDVIDVPIVKVGKRNELLISEYYKLVQQISNDYNGIVHASVEKVNSAACPAAMTAFVLSATYYVPQALFTALSISQDLVMPTKWKKHYSLLKKDKDASRAVASRFYPVADLKYKKDHNRADAILIARYTWETNPHLRTPNKIIRRKLK